MARKRGFFAELQHQQMLQERERQRQLKQAAKEAEQAARARERALAQEAREQRELHVKQQQDEAAAYTVAAQDRMNELGRVLVDGLRHRGVFSFRQMRRSFRPRPFEAPSALATPARQPRWERYAPPPPSGVGRLFKGTHNRAIEQAKASFARDMALYQHSEHERLTALAAAEARHRQGEESRRQEVEQHNAQVDDLEKRVMAGLPEAVEDYFELLIERSPLPADLPVDVEVAYQPDSKKLLMIRELPGVDVIPQNREYTYVKSRDEIVAKPRLVKEIKQAYANLVAQIVLRTMRDVFEVRPSELVDEVAVNAHVSTRNRATGKPERPCLVSVSATRKQFEELVLTELDPAECLKYFNALVSPHPWDLEAVRPIFDPDLSKYRLVDAHDVAAGLGGRPVLLEMKPFEFEVLVKQLFEAMGMKSWVTQASRDDGLDAIAVNEDPIMGGVCVIQAKRYKGTVEPDAVRALAGVMDDKRASRGVLVTTSRFGKASHDFVARHGRIQLIEGPHLKHLLSEYLNLDVLLGPPSGR
ncbi:MULTISPECIES: restriction endonuclease [Amycolatopsis]|uniref:restriction endonuclease n=1 Tax=Amycolatopsis TaxID=1813 RepID=UPI001E290FEA|nr:MULTISPECIES: restriction endonuclease [Amycolatopsis]